MKICCLIHAEFELPGYVLTWAEQRGHNFSMIRSYNAEKLPTVSEFDFLLVMGGPQTLLALQQYPYLNHELVLIQSAIMHHKHVLGICLGAQLIAEALGAKTTKSPEKEIGNFPIFLTEAAKQNIIFENFPSEFMVSHWHGDMVGIPDGAVVLASSLGCPNQIIQFNARTYGFQCHLEFNAELVKLLQASEPENEHTGQFIQSPQEMADFDYTEINQRLGLFLDKFLKI